MYTIKWVSDQLGLATGTLRAWEQRYGIVHPLRSDGGYRLYDDADVTALRTMARLVKEGIQPAQAAERVRAGAQTPQPRQDRTDAAVSGLPRSGALIAASANYDVHALEEALDAAFAAARFEYVVDEWLMPALVAVGDAWESGGLDVAQEHFISSGVMRRVASAFDAAGHARGGPHVLTGLAPGALHEIATLAFGTMLRRAGFRVTYLGPDLPVASWAEAARTTRPQAVVVGAPRTADTASAVDVATALRTAAPALRVCLGGRGATSEYAIGGTTLSEAADWLAGILIDS